MNNVALKSALTAEVQRQDALILSIQRKIVETDPETEWVPSLILEHRLYAAMGKREGLMKGLELLGIDDV